MVTQLAQLPDSSACVKEVLLTMPIMRRQQLQEIIRASLMQDQNQKQVNSTGPSFSIKLPAKVEESKKEENIVPAACRGELEDKDNSEEEEEDDWDTFQSFPSTNEVDPTRTDIQDSRSIENTISDGGLKGDSISVPHDEVEETTATISDGGFKGETISVPEDEVGEITAENQMARSNQTQDLNGSQDGFHDDKLSDAHLMEKDTAVLRPDDVILPDAQFEVGKGPETCENLEVQKRIGGSLSSEHAEDVKAPESSYEDHQKSGVESSETNEGVLPDLQPAELQSMPLDDRNEDMKEQTAPDDHHEEKDMRDITSVRDHHEEKDIKDITSLKDPHEERKAENEDQHSTIELSEQSPEKLEQTTHGHHEEKDIKDITSLKDHHEERKPENKDQHSNIDLSEQSPKNL